MVSGRDYTVVSTLAPGSRHLVPSGGLTAKWGTATTRTSGPVVGASQAAWRLGRLGLGCQNTLSFSCPWRLRGAVGGRPWCVDTGVLAVWPAPGLTYWGRPPAVVHPLHCMVVMPGVHGGVAACRAPQVVSVLLFSCFCCWLAFVWGCLHADGFCWFLLCFVVSSICGFGLDFVGCR